MSKSLRRQTVLSAVLGLVLGLATAAPGRGQTRDDVRQALVAGAYDKAVSLALDALRGDPADAEARFLLARAYAYSGRRDEAEAVLGALLAEHPADADLLVFKARLLSWRGDLEASERTFRRALELEPRSADALAGLADLAAWRGDHDAALVFCRRALDLDAGHAGALFRTGTVLLGQGDYGRARGYLARAVELEPRNGDFARALAAAAPVFARRAEVWLSGRTEHWSDGRSDSSALGFAGLFGLFHGRARLAVKADRLWRAGESDDRIGFEVYPQLWRGAYGYVDLSLAPKAHVAPGASFHLEVYQSVLKKLEVSLGARRMSFAGNGIILLAASAALYAGPWYPNVRILWTGSDQSAGLTWMAGLRRYLADASYVWAAAGRGSRSFEAGSSEELLAAPAWFAEAGFDLYVLRGIKLRGCLSRRKETGGPSSTAVAAVLGYRF